MKKLLLSCLVFCLIFIWQLNCNQQKNDTADLQVNKSKTESASKTDQTEDQVEKEPVEREEDFNASIRIIGSQIEISNKNSYNWTELEAMINWRVRGGGYYYKVGALTAKSKKTIPSSLFLRIDDPFDINTSNILNIKIMCQTPHGQKDYLVDIE